MIGFLDRRPLPGPPDGARSISPPSGPPARTSGGPSTTSQRCRPCEEELATTTLVLHALRRLHEETLRAEPAADGWPRLRARLARRRREPSRLLSGLPGIVAAAGLCAALVGPAAIDGGRPVVYNEAPRGAPAPYLLFESSRERARVAGLLPDVEIPLPYRGIRIAPPPIAADLPPSMGRQVSGSRRSAPPRWRRSRSTRPRSAGQAGGDTDAIVTGPVPGGSAHRRPGRASLTHADGRDL